MVAPFGECALNMVQTGTNVNAKPYYRPLNKQSAETCVASFSSTSA